MSKEILPEFEFAKSIAWQIEPSQDFIYVLNNKNRKLYWFKDISKDIWLQIGQHKSFNNILETLMEEYQVDYETLYNDVKDYIYELQEEGLVIHNE
ncbi:MAG: PqqD family protein [Clostridium argentinense]|uniref:PqqD family protein n=1 Tax=uncultured Clostridium sp. TaxID=59620 RepID=UPI001DB7589A|nr:PqqD family protein [uncultured Clostridium sp.]MBS5824330.1 PqqD family protein [Clostridium argentinense]MDU1350682.1 PqqD family protein [Clostridium argentinense]